MALPSPIPDELVELIARRFQLQSEPTRIRLFDRLHEGETTVHQLPSGCANRSAAWSSHLVALAALVQPAAVTQQQRSSR
jgi:hypothetical protein